jgi:glycosyltransferase involved in cell wall biosynthesis
MLKTEERVPVRKIVVIENFLDDRAFEPISDSEVVTQRARWGIPAGAFVIGAVARLAPVKNHGLLLRAISQLDAHCHGVLIGGGPSKGKLEELARELGVQDRVHFVGQLTSDTNLHSAFDVSVLCSLSEGFPNSIIEALAAARPVVATPVGGVLDAIENGKTGFLTPTDDPRALAAALASLRADAELRRKVGEAGRSLARSRHSKAVVIEKLSQLYETLAADDR